MEIKSKDEVEKLERDTIDELEIKLILEEYNTNSKTSDTYLESFDKKNNG